MCDGHVWAINSENHRRLCCVKCGHVTYLHVYEARGVCKPAEFSGLDYYDGADQSDHPQEMHVRKISNLGYNPYEGIDWQAKPPEYKPKFKRGDVVRVNDKGSPNHDREDPVWTAPSKDGEPYHVWHEDGLTPYSEGQLEGTKRKAELPDTLPPTKPLTTNHTSGVPAGSGRRYTRNHNHSKE